MGGFSACSGREPSERSKLSAMTDLLPPAPPQMPVSPSAPSAFPYYGTPPLLDAGPPAPAHHGPPAPAHPAAPGPRRPRARWALAGTVAASLILGAAGGWVAGHEASDGGASTAPVTLSGSRLDVHGILARMGPSVVAISTEVTQRQGPFLARGQSAGTGVILTADGQVLTNAHVVAGATSITVTVNGSDEALPARLVAADTVNDLALLQVTEPVQLSAATLGSSTATSVGDDVVAVGNALALEGGLSVTRGIVSALDRSIEAGTGRTAESLDGLIQTDAAISSGNSGGPLVNARGEVIGINTAVAGSGNGTTASNIGFAIPIDTARQVVEQLRQAG